MQRLFFRELKNYALIILAILSAGMGIKGYLLSSHFIDGGVTGISMLLNNIFGFPLFVLIPVINLPFIVLAYYQMGLRFAIKSSIAILGLALCLAFLPYPDVTPDKLITAIFGGFFIGLGIGLAIRADAVLDGTEIAALIVSKSTGHLKVADVILILNVVIFGAAAFFLGVEPASYSILTYFAAAKTIDFLLHGVDEFTGVTIISEKSGLIRKEIVDTLGRSVTVYKGKGTQGESEDHGLEHDIIFTVVTRLEIGKLQNVINRIDEQAVVIQHNITNMQGGMINRKVH